MPGFDRTGPEGNGPLTGGRRGSCRSSNMAEGRQSSDFFGRGKGRRLGTNRGFENRISSSGFNSTYDAKELDALKSEVDSARSVIDSMKKRIAELEKTSG